MWYVYFLELGNGDIYVGVETEKNARDLENTLNRDQVKLLPKRDFSNYGSSIHIIGVRAEAC